MPAKTRSRNIDVSSALDELFPTRGGPRVDEDAVWIERDLIEPNPRQPRRKFAPDTLRELGRSLGAVGQLQACVVRPHPERAGRFQIISGERRWRAAAPEFANLQRLRCVIREASDAESFRLALAENVHREDLSIVERARALVQIKESEPGFTWDRVAEQAHVSKRRVLHLVGLLDLPEEVVSHLEAGDINEKHARALLSLQKQPKQQSRLLQEIISGDLSGNAALARVESQSARATKGAQVTSSDSDQQILGSARANDEGANEEGAPSQRGGSNVTDASSHKVDPRHEAHRTGTQADSFLDPVLRAINAAIAQVGFRDGEADDGEPGFTIIHELQTPALGTQVHEQLRQIKAGIESLESALLTLERKNAPKTKRRL